MGDEMTETQKDDFAGELAQRMVALFAMWLEEQEQGQELIASLRLVNDVLERQEREQVVSQEDYQAAYDAVQRLLAVTVTQWKDMHAAFEIAAEDFAAVLVDGEPKPGYWWCEDCETCHVGYSCPKEDDSEG
jgi:hypothetical protein